MTILAIMQSNTQNLRFQGFINTPNLWEDDAVYGVPQLSIEPSGLSFHKIFKGHQRLGKLVEHFVLHQLRHIPNLSLIAENHQVQDDTLTIGELDCLFQLHEVLMHLEIVYKFYLYDEKVGTAPLDHWIGPNRRDSLVKKLNKLKDKQLPLLHHPLTQSWLTTFGYNAKDFQQCVCFKAQLFLPYGGNITIQPLNQDCVQGFYLRPEQLQDFKECKFYIPKKLDWLMAIPIQIDWLSFETFKTKLQTFLNEQSAPLCWIKQPNGETQKCFAVWW